LARILIYSQDVIGRSMAGPGIRYFEFANALAKHHDVTLAAPNTPDIEADGFELVSYHNKRRLLVGYDFLIAQSVSPAMAYLARRGKTRIILDFYDPVMLEELEIYHHKPVELQSKRNRRALADLRLSLALADHVICATEKQRDLWLGSLMALGRITPREYTEDASLHDLVGVVPFGLQERPPEKTGDGFRKQLGIDPSDTVVLWGGGIWNWFDPLTLIKAIGEISETRSDVKLVFMGLKHPNEHIAEMEMATKAVALARELGLESKQVFFNYGWVPYAERQNHFLEADIGASTHFNHLESRFSFRTRMLDYLWAGLPIVATEGDSLADLIRTRNLGRVVPYEDPSALAAAITKLADDREARDQIAANIETVRSEYTWSQVVRPILTMVADDRGTDKRLSYRERRLILSSYRHSLQHIRQEKGLLPLVGKFGSTVYKFAFRRY
jgi:glycosyltransferase involved in cell wall biosynthesis